jgi:hypothetical protein
VNDDVAITGIKAGTATVTVNLNSPAPASGTYSMNVVSDNTGLVSSGTVTFAAGATSATYVATVNAVSTATTVKLTVTNDGQLNAVGRARVLPPTLKTATLPVTTIQGGLSTTLTLTLDTKAPANWTPTITFTDPLGNPVTVASTNGNTTFDAGTNTLNITIDTQTVATRTPIVVVTTLNGVVKKAKVALLP